ncbi:hypothetical protein ACFVXH_39710 [Kitasatospora sp. NPDC058184]|uniref:hypothetical protein n=1 Tax=Kitasatospora sp. NPDC058184 TaxID=3346370 RepID=UPI0036DD0E7D
MTYPQPTGQQPAHPPVPLQYYPEQPRPLYGPDATAYVVLPTGAAPLHQGVVQAIGPDGQPLLLTQAPAHAYGMPAYQPMPHPMVLQPPVPQQAAPATVQDYLTPGMVKLLLGTLAVGGASIALVFLFQAIVAAAAALQTVAIVAAIVFGGIFLSRLTGTGGGKVNNKINIDIDAVAGRRIKMRTPRRWL